MPLMGVNYRLNTLITAKQNLRNKQQRVISETRHLEEPRLLFLSLYVFFMVQETDQRKNKSNNEENKFAKYCSLLGLFSTRLC